MQIALNAVTQLLLVFSMLEGGNKEEGGKG